MISNFKQRNTFSVTNAYEPVDSDVTLAILDTIEIKDEMSIKYLLNIIFKSEKAIDSLLQCAISSNFRNKYFISELFERLIDYNVSYTRDLAVRYYNLDLIDLLIDTRLKKKHKDILDSILCEIRMTA